MSPANRTAQEIAAVKRALSAGKITKEVAESALAALSARGASYEARWTLPNGKERTKTFSTKKHGKNAQRMAEQHEALQKAKIQTGEYSDMTALKATVSQVLDFYLTTHIKGKTSEKNVRAHVADINEIWGERLTLRRLDQDPDRLIQDLRSRLEAKRDRKTAWNRKVTAQAAITKYCLKKRIRLLNPFLGCDWPQPESKRNQAPDFNEYQAMVKEAGKDCYPKWLPALFVCGWEHALRMGEFLSWHWEGVTLDPSGDDLPWAKTEVEKQGRGRKVYRELPLKKAAAEALRSLPAVNKEIGSVFPLKRTSVDRYVRRVLEASGNGHFNFHDFRRSWKRRHPELSQRYRMQALGQKTEKADEHYLLEMERKELEPIMRPSWEK